MAFMKKSTGELQINPFTTIGKEWFLLTAGTPEQFNTMTCSWGGLGVIWNVPAVTAYVRASRYTFEFLERGSKFSICVFPEEYRKALSFCGSNSGRDVDKVQATGLTPIALDGVPAFAEAKQVFVCEQMYGQMMSASDFRDQSLLDTFYGMDAMHKMYIGRVLGAYVHE